MLRAQPSLGIYISVPFCAQKCSFCNFASGVFPRERMAAYVDRVAGEIANAAERAVLLGAELPVTVDTVYFGGGTPSLLPPELFWQISDAIRAGFSLASNAEWTVECAPGQLPDATLAAMVECGVNRISFGAQSFVDRETAAVGRQHTRRQAEADIASVRRAGVENITVDLLAGLPYQTLDSWRESLEVLAALDVPHASVYMLEVDDDSRLGRELQLKSSKYHADSVPADDTIAACYELACEVLASRGLAQYEISNFARDGYKSRHNLKYWSREPYLGFGLDAHSMLRADNVAIRFANSDEMAAYLRGECGPGQRIGLEQQLEEAWFLGLRRNAGVDAAELRREFGAEALAMEEIAGELVKDELLEAGDGCYRLTPRGRLISNDVFAAFLAVPA